MIRGLINLRDKSVEINMLNETLKVFNDGYYKFDNKKVKTSAIDILSDIMVILPNDIEKEMVASNFNSSNITSNRCKLDCQNIDTFSMVRILKSKGVTNIIALNLASPTNPGGGVRRGAKAQEEDLCRKSSLLLSLESQVAKVYYDYNRKANTLMGTSAMMFTPKVEIIRDDNGRFLPEPVETSVLTCAAPKLVKGEKLDMKNYRSLVYNRIGYMLTVLAHQGFKNLVLGAWGCGAYGNDAATISDLFKLAIVNFKYQGYSYNEVFDSITFAVLDKTDSQYNFKQFKRNFRDL